RGERRLGRPPSRRRDAGEISGCRKHGRAGHARRRRHRARRAARSRMPQRTRELLVMPAMTDDEIALMNELLTSEMGLWFPDHKREILESRLGARIAELRLRSVLDYYVL